MNIVEKPTNFNDYQAYCDALIDNGNFEKYMKEWNKDINNKPLSTVWGSSSPISSIQGKVYTYKEAKALSELFYKTEYL